MTLGVSYETSREQMVALLTELREVLATHEGIDQGFHFAHFSGFGGSSLDVQIYCFSESTDWLTFLKVRETLMLRFMQVVDALGLEFAFPTQTVYLRDEQWPQRQSA